MSMCTRERERERERDRERERTQAGKRGRGKEFQAGPTLSTEPDAGLKI